MVFDAQDENRRLHGPHGEKSAVDGEKSQVEFGLSASFPLLMDVSSR